MRSDVEENVIHGYGVAILQLEGGQASIFFTQASDRRLVDVDVVLRENFARGLFYILSVPIGKDRDRFCPREQIQRVNGGAAVPPDHGDATIDNGWAVAIRTMKN